MQLFYLINGWAGRSEWLDNTLRFFYVGAVPLLLTALAAFLILAPRRFDTDNYVAPRRRIAAATFVAFALCALVTLGVPLFQKQILGGAPISPRPFMTHWVNALVVEPNDNSFPCYEVMFAAATAMLLWAHLPAAGIAACCAVLLLGFSRTYCGMNFLGDSVAGAMIGSAISTLALAALRVPLQLPTFSSGARRLAWRVRHQAAFAVLALVGFAGFSFYSLTTTPAHSSKFKTFWGSAPATAAPAKDVPVGSAITDDNAATATLTSGIHEGEGGVLASEGQRSMAEPGDMLLASRATRLDGHLPEAETHLSKALSTLQLPHRLLGVNVAQVRAGNSGYRCAAVRFEVKWHGPIERRRVAQTAAQIVKRAFHADNQLQHIDVLGVKLHNGSAESADHRTAPRPVFTASVARNDLIIENKPAWVNWSGLDGGSWLRARSALYIDASVLPPSAPKPAAGEPGTETAAAAMLAPRPAARPKAAPKPVGKPTVKPAPKSAPKPGAGKRVARKPAVQSRRPATSLKRKTRKRAVRRYYRKRSRTHRFR